MTPTTSNSRVSFGNETFPESSAPAARPSNPMDFIFVAFFGLVAVVLFSVLLLGIIHSVQDSVCLVAPKDTQQSPLWARNP